MTGGVRRKCGSVWNRIGSLAHRTQEFCEETLLVCSFFLQHELERTLLSLWLSSSWCSVYLCVVSDSVAVSREIRCGDVEISRNLGGMGIGSKAIIRSLCFVTYALPSCSTFFGQRAKLPFSWCHRAPRKAGGWRRRNTRGCFQFHSNAPLLQLRISSTLSRRPTQVS